MFAETRVFLTFIVAGSRGEEELKKRSLSPAYARANKGVVRRLVLNIMLQFSEIQVILVN